MQAALFLDARSSPLVANTARPESTFTSSDASQSPLFLDWFIFKQYRNHCPAVARRRSYLASPSLAILHSRSWSILHLRPCVRERRWCADDLLNRNISRSLVGLYIPGENGRNMGSGFSHPATSRACLVHELPHYGVRILHFRNHISQ